MVYISFVTLFYANSGISVSTGLTIFTLQSIAFWTNTGMAYVRDGRKRWLKGNENSFICTFLTGFIGYSDFYSFSENSFLIVFLFLSLLGIIIFNLVGLYLISAEMQKKNSGYIWSNNIFYLFIS